MDIKNVMVPVDFSQPSGMVVNYAVAFARVLHAKLTLVHVLEPPQPMLEVDTVGEIAILEVERREEALRKLEEVLVPEDEDDLDLELVLRSGNIQQEIAAAIRECHADIVILGTHGRGFLGRLILGSTTEGLLRRLHVPVMTVCHTTSPKAFKRILFATDLSESSRAAFAFALDVAGVLQTEILAIHAMGGPVLSGELGTPVQVEKLAVEEVRQRLQLLVTEGSLRGITVQTLIADGSAAEQILRAAHENDADMILLAIESKGLIERALLGTTAEQVVREATVPVLSVPFPVQVETQRENAEHVVQG
jgi:nucleotide-binding universal stress UspA family protein